MYVCVCGRSVDFHPPSSVCILVRANKYTDLIRMHLCVGLLIFDRTQVELKQSYSVLNIAVRL